MTRGTINQFLTGATAGDAITDQALLIRGWLRDAGYDSEIFAWHLHSSMETEVRPMSAHRPSRGETRGIYHHSIGSDVPPYLARRGFRVILIYHNITPPEFFASSDPLRAYLARLGIDQLALLRPITDLALAVSGYNAAELAPVGYDQTAVLPICLRTERYETPSNENLVNALGGARPRLLFIGRLAPNKRQEDLVKLLYCLRRIRPDAQLTLVGDRWEVGYDRWIETLAADLGVGGGLTLAGKVSQEDMITYLRTADLFVSMSEHEGFGVPLIESMFLGLPVMAYGAAAVPETMNGTGVLFYRKAFEELAELADLLVSDQPLRRRIITGQRERVRAFLEPEVKRQFLSYLQQAGW